MATYKLIASSTVGSGGASSITFSSIPGTYTDLAVLISARSSTSALTDDLTFKVNSSTTSYSNRNLYGANSAVGSYSNNYTNKGYIAAMNAASTTASTFGNVLLYCPNYAGSNNKSFSVDSVMEANSNSEIYAILNAVLWSNTSAITSIDILFNSGNLVQYSTAYLYGISNA